MGISPFDRYAIYPARLGSLLFQQIDEAHLRPQSNKSEVVVGGALDRSAVITAFGEPVWTVKTADLGAVLAGISLTGGYPWDTSAPLSTSASLLQFEKRADGGAFIAAGSSVHHLASMIRGWACIEEISATQDSIEGASAQLTGVALSEDGETAPINWLALQALTSTPAYGALYYLSKVMVGTGSPVELAGVQSVRIRPGIKFLVKRASGMTWAIAGAIVARKPEITLQLSDPGPWYTLFGPSTLGLDLASLKVNCYFQKGLHGGNRVARATTAHVSIYAATGDETPDNMGVTGVENDLGLELTIRPTGVIAMATGVAIP